MTLRGEEATGGDHSLIKYVSRGLTIPLVHGQLLHADWLDRADGLWQKEEQTRLNVHAGEKNFRNPQPKPTSPKELPQESFLVFQTNFVFLCMC